MGGNDIRRTDDIIMPINDTIIMPSSNPYNLHISWETRNVNKTGLDKRRMFLQLNVNKGDIAK